MALPPLTPEQRQAALDKALAARKERAEIKNALKHRTLSLREALTIDSEAVRKMTAHSLLASMPGIGKVRAQQLLTELEISPSRHIQGLGPRQRERLLSRFPSPS